MLPASLRFEMRVAAVGGHILPTQCQHCREYGTRAVLPGGKGPMTVCAICDHGFDIPKLQEVPE